MLQETLPTGKYDRLGARPSDGIGSGAHSTSLGLNSQYFLWMPNGRILRTRFNVSYARSDAVTVEDVSVYGTSQGFRGHARPGRVFVVDSAWEYSATRNWVLALDIAYEHDTRTTLNGLHPHRRQRATDARSAGLRLERSVHAGAGRRVQLQQPRWPDRRRGVHRGGAQRERHGGASGGAQHGILKPP